VVGVRFGSRIFTGPGALALVGIVLAVVVAAVVWSRPSWWMVGSGEIWIGFIAYWSRAARHAAPIQRSESGASRRQHELLLNLSILLLFLPLPWLSTVMLPLGEWRPLWGLLLQLSGVLLALWARRHLGRNWSAVVAIKVDHTLVQSGPYRLVRHPIYTAMLTMAAGTAIVSGSVHGLLGVAMMAVAYARKIPMEEQGMGETFGDAYVEYRRRSWALVPFIF
jgi:protein-S-isoprenylcysteine O-methyltransferase Ste14